MILKVIPTRTTHCVCTSISTSYPQPEGHMTKYHMTLGSESVRSVRETCWDTIISQHYNEACRSLSSCTSSNNMAARSVNLYSGSMQLRVRLGRNQKRRVWYPVPIINKLSEVTLRHNWLSQEQVICPNTQNWFL